MYEYLKDRYASKAADRQAELSHANVHSAESQVGGLHNEEHCYQRALDFLKTNEPEIRLDVQLSPNSDGLRSRCTRYMAMPDILEFNIRLLIAGSLSNTVPTALHSTSSIAKSVHQTLGRVNKGALCKHIIPRGDSEYSITDDEGSTSTKTPDGELNYLSDEGSSVLTFVIEVGLSEAYDQLRRDIKLWLSCCHASLSR
ncbi:hypothetical protein V1509DRAFT_611850 [Lipomyces kononenkoae]